MWKENPRGTWVFKTRVSSLHLRVLLSQTQCSSLCRSKYQIVQSPTQCSIVQSELQRSWFFLCSLSSDHSSFVIRSFFLSSDRSSFWVSSSSSSSFYSSSTGFIFVLFLLFDFRLVRATASQSQTDSIHNFIVKVGFYFFFLGDAFSCFFFFFFLKKISCGFLLFVILDLQRSTGFLLLLGCYLFFTKKIES